jgi:hypothetical protein
MNDELAYKIKVTRNIHEDIRIGCVKDGMIEYSYERVNAGIGPHHTTIKCKISFSELGMKENG